MNIPIVDKNIIVGNLRQDIREIVIADNYFIVTDDNVFALYPALFEGAKVFVLSDSEFSKNLNSVQTIIECMLNQGCNRNTTVVSVGGGVVSDIAGFVAAIFMRGVEWVCVPTTLLAQVDAGLGGKTAVNLKNYKNIVGAFWLPKSVLCDINMLATLNEQQWLSGVGEVVKTSLLNASLWGYLNDNLQSLMLKDWKIVKEIINQCIAIKSQIVALDLNEAGLRRHLNVGHTLGHAIESWDNFRLTHGEYVLLGIKYETELFAGNINQDYLDEIRIILKKLIVSTVAFDVREVVENATKDKKNKGNNIVFIVPTDKGKVDYFDKEPKEVVKLLQQVL
ncbi:MAG: 3-dehydroquinate synthase [Clostridiales bacterium]|jgi:3-dehydroquinate synthase|nr:3-dehydroquinate synthase [Clostridiales bacterium]